MAGHIKTWIEIASDGERGTSNAYVVISAGENKEFRYEIPGIVEARWESRPGHKPRVELVLEDVVMRTRVAISSDSAKIEDLMTEIVASRLAHDDDDEKMKYETPYSPMTHKPIPLRALIVSASAQLPRQAEHAPHCAVIVSKKLGDFSLSCDCGAVPGGF